MSRKSLWIVLAAMVVLCVAGCGGHAKILVTIAGPNTATEGVAVSYTATVTHDSTNKGVAWTCTTTGTAACSSANFSAAQTASGVATSFTPPSAVESVTITATSVADASDFATITVTITAVPAQNFSFMANGEENKSPDFPAYCVAGVVAVAITASADGSFAVTGGEQDYNDGDGTTATDDLITGGKLVLAANGTGTLTVVTKSGIPGVKGTETFAVAFPNAKHAVIMQFDGTATSIGSLDLQTSTALPSGSFSFAASGQDTSHLADAFGGVITAAPSTGALTGTVDINDAGALSLNNAIPAGAALAGPDAFGRGTVSGNTGIATSLAYYVVGSGVIRLIDIDTTDTAVGSAYSQGASPNFSPASIGTSVFSVGSSLSFYAAVGQFTTVPATPSFSGVGDENESVLDLNAPSIAESFNGTYTLASDGRGFFTFTSGLGSISVLGVYAVDSSLNILDPNNTTSGGGGALIAEMDANLVGIGSIVPQTDIVVADFSGSYAFGAQGDTSANANEFDFVGVAKVTEPAGTFAGTGALSDPFATQTSGVESSTATFTATATPDLLNKGRYTLNPVAVASTASDFTAFDFASVTVYQASAGQLFWVEVDNGSFFGGSLEQF